MNDTNSKTSVEYLHRLREDWLLSNEAKSVLDGKEISHSSDCFTGKDKWSQEIYSDFGGVKKLIVFEISKNKIIGKEHHCLGCEIIKDKYVLINNEQLWKEGIP